MNQQSVETKPSRPYERHKWLATDGGNAHCFVCGIGERTWNKRIQNDSLANWDCLAVQAMSKPARKAGAK